MSPSWIWEPAVAYGMSHEGKGGEGSGQGISSVPRYGLWNCGSESGYR